MPTNPPLPEVMNSISAAFCASVSLISPVVRQKTTTSKVFSLSLSKCSTSSVTTNSNTSLVASICLNTSADVGIDECLKPSVLLNTRARLCARWVVGAFAFFSPVSWATAGVTHRAHSNISDTTFGMVSILLRWRERELPQAREAFPRGLEPLTSGSGVHIAVLEPFPSRSWVRFFAPSVAGHRRDHRMGKRSTQEREAGGAAAE